MQRFITLICRAVLLALVPVLALTACGSTHADPVSIELNVPAEGLAETIRQPVPLGAEVTLRVTTAKDDGIHIHGYELEFDTPAGKPVEQVFTANMAGAYEVESHQAGQVYMKLIVK